MGIKPSVVVSELVRQVSGLIRTPPSQSVDNATGIQLQEWKEAWTAGAQARWSGSKDVRNPHGAGSKRAAAWDAGRRWAELHPDRRRNTAVRFAHPHRRSTDYSSRLISRATAGAAGLSALTLAGWLWQMRRRGRARNGNHATDER